ncbi:hypothetical protein [Streptomyces sp. SID3212]|uniref:hypothetical protein n=1 Tax=Streptomyces sp. SID3212 TaxID=2690259 RepID=UPI00136ECE03|nr:hypothetical protein [Streptomyces sp. SID3212]MYV53053.1 hypothetical protein [Streptomyces sp. SID3212]
MAELEEEFQAFNVKAERGWAKADGVGAVGALTGVSGEISGVTSGVKLANFEFDLRQHLKDKALERANLHPMGLLRRITEVKRKGQNDRNVTNRAHERITELTRDLNQKLRRKADKSAVGASSTRQNSQVATAQLRADRAIAEVRRLHDEIARLNSRF